MKTEESKGEPSDVITVALHRFVRRLRALAKRGNGPCAGGGTLDQYSRGRQEEAAEWRRLLREALKELDGVEELREQWFWEVGEEPGTVVLHAPWQLKVKHNAETIKYALEHGKPEMKKMFEAGMYILRTTALCQPNVSGGGREENHE